MKAIAMTKVERQARQRVLGSDALRPHEDIIFDPDWYNEPGHLEWVATAPEPEILDWAEVAEGSAEQVLADSTRR